ncbi:hypothetical protein Ssi02_25850 [Sinosporangium siamense]|uniref:Putative zinc-finger domain-containing protein n=1 Tax=Sinosporangium siamense TaxID=1367973 RepID=A0A919RH85_9ACTN|nr:hypothetical protein Ssi02_25850 [Sinosporangium siamense]
MELATAYMDDALEESARGDLTAHLAGCGGCERYVGQLRATAGLLGRLRNPQRHAANGSAEAPPEALPEELPAEARERLLAAFRERRTADPRSPL